MQIYNAHFSIKPYITKIMKNTLLLILLLLGFAAGRLSAQNINRDSLMRDSIGRDSIIRDSIMNIPKIISLGKMAGRRLRLSPAQREQFLSAKKNARSDLFKPRASIVSDVTLLNDSVYVTAFRMAAWQKARHRRTAGHYVLFGGILAFSALVLTAVAELLINGIKV